MTTAAVGEDNSKAPARSRRRTQDWSSEEKLRVVLESLKLSDAELGAFLRREGLHEAELREWREAVVEAGRDALEGHERPSSKKRKRRRSAFAFWRGSCAGRRKRSPRRARPALSSRSRPRRSDRPVRRALRPPPRRAEAPPPVLERALSRGALNSGTRSRRRTSRFPWARSGRGRRDATCRP